MDFNKLFLVMIRSNPFALFIYTIISKWYLIVAVAGLMVCYWVFQGLAQAGILRDVEKIVVEVLYDVRSVAKYCTPKIRDLGAVWDCIQNLPEYTPDADEEKLNKLHIPFVEHDDSYSDDHRNPYAPK
jgi:hypothetical protein